MIRVNDLIRFNNVCKEILQNNAILRKNEVFITFNPIDNLSCEIIFVADTQFARIVLKYAKPCIFGFFQISWTDFNKVCSLFENAIEIETDKNLITFRNDNKKIICARINTDLHKAANFKFDFNDAIKISMDDCFVPKDLMTIYKKVALFDKYVAATDGSFGVINILNYDTGYHEAELFLNKFKDGTWFYNKNYNIIVSEDKKLAYTINKATGMFPTKAMQTIFKTPLNSYFCVNVKEFSKELEACATFSEQIKLKIEDGFLKISCIGKDNIYNTKLKINQVGNSKEIKFLIKYLQNFCLCKDENNMLKIFYDTDLSSYMLRTESKTKKMVAMGMK